MKALEIKKEIYWVGAIDWDLRSFHGYLTQRGSTYNAYLVIDEKITLIDTTKATQKDQIFKRIASIIDPAKIDYVISNHVEMDHSGSIPDILALAPGATVFTSPNGEKGLRAHFKKDWKLSAVKTGDAIPLGKRSLKVVTTPMVHWPDNMVCYMPEEKILFSND
jgi:flavorubredoxin